MRIAWNSFGGRFSDNPRALYEALPEHDAVWLADPRHAAEFPAGVELVAPADARAALESADLVVSNTHLELAWDKRGRYLQTWHGTPLKRIHADVLWAPEGRLADLDRDVARWDALLSPNAYSTPLLQGAFRFTGELAETGYPRNDVLLAPDRDARRARVRAELGLADGQQVVLYAPTWRDDRFYATDGQDTGHSMDLDALTAALPDAVVLLRLHYLVAGRLGDLGPQLRDVSDHPQVSDLYLAADVLVTDYSSVFFDFAVTGKPIAFLVPDLDDYRDRLRGFYVDLAEIAPGPLLASTGALVDVLRDPTALPPYEAFRTTFCALEDGGATARVLQRFVPELMGAP